MDLEVRTNSDKMSKLDKAVSSSAVAYFKSGREAEEAVARYQRIKFAAEVAYEARKQLFEEMTKHLIKWKTKETDYKQAIDAANNFIIEYRNLLWSFCEELCQLEGPRSEAVHASVNSFVVFEMSAEMNNKYDVNKFSK
jgi:hypothetical protein